MYSSLLALLDANQVALVTPSENIWGYIGFAVVVVMLVWDRVKKSKAKKYFYKIKSAGCNLRIFI